MLVFFSDDKRLSDFLAFTGDLGTTPYYITPNWTFDPDRKKKKRSFSDEEVDRLISMACAGLHGKVTLLTKEFGRGLDFQAEAEVVENGGVHVIQTFFSVDIKEEIQIRGRTARNDDPGSYELVVCREHLKKIEHNGYTFSFVESELQPFSYQTLDERRQVQLNGYCADKMNRVKEMKKEHDLSMALFHQAVGMFDGRHVDDTDIVDFIKKADSFHD